MSAIARQVRSGVLRAARGTGVFSAVKRSGWRRRRLAILMFHGISIADEHDFDPGLYLSVEQLRASLELIRRHGCSVMTLAEAVDRADQDDLPDCPVVLTFDDGNFDFYSRALPLLREYGYPATNFVSTYYVEFQAPVFNPACRYVAWKGRGQSISPAGIAVGNEPLRTDSRAGRWKALLRMLDFKRRERLRGEEQVALLSRLADRLDVDLQPMFAARMFHHMTPAELASLPTDLVDVQLHTHRHRSHRDRAKFLQEIEDNRASLSRAVGDEREFTLFCYPSGEYAIEQLAWLREAGIAAAVTCEPALASAWANRLLLPRIAVTASQLPLGLEAWLTGTRQLLSRPRSFRLGGSP